MKWTPEELDALIRTREIIAEMKKNEKKS